MMFANLAQILPELFQIATANQATTIQATMLAPLAQIYYATHAQVTSVKHARTMLNITIQQTSVYALMASTYQVVPVQPAPLIFFKLATPQMAKIFNVRKELRYRMDNHHALAKLATISVVIAASSVPISAKLAQMMLVAQLARRTQATTLKTVTVHLATTNL